MFITNKLKLQATKYLVFIGIVIVKMTNNILNYSFSCLSKVLFVGSIILTSTNTIEMNDTIIMMKRLESVNFNLIS